MAGSRNTSRVPSQPWASPLMDRPLIAESGMASVRLIAIGNSHGETSPKRIPAIKTAPLTVSSVWQITNVPSP